MQHKMFWVGGRWDKDTHYGIWEKEILVFLRKPVDPLLSEAGHTRIQSMVQNMTLPFNQESNTLILSQWLSGCSMLSYLNACGENNTD